MMKDVLLRDAEKYTLAHKRKRRWQRAVTALSGVVVFCTTYALILPAITMEKKCEIPEHTHTDACYRQTAGKRVPVCTPDALELHRHTNDCYDGAGNLICGYADFVVHRHDSSCYDENGALWCTLPEMEEHRHTDECYTLPEAVAAAPAQEVHTHGEDCYTMERGELTCQEHVHGEECYTETTELVCGLEETPDVVLEATPEEGAESTGEQEVIPGHQHGESCYETHRELSCGFESDHQHTDDCYEWNKRLTCDQSTEPVEPVEAAPQQEAEPVLTCTKPEIQLHTHTPDCFDKDGNRICGQVQVLEHVHSDACFAQEEPPLTCTDTSKEHTHTPRCYGTWELVCGMEEHTHGEACKATNPEEPVFCGKEPHTHGESCRNEQGELICGMEEHTHSEACTATEPEKAVFCGKEPHTHGDTCRDDQGELTCTLEEHTHSLACYADPTADVETAEIWEQTFGDVILTGDWRLDALAIAQSQLGYAESTKNYAVAEDGQTLMGYTRYGAWQGTPYDEWNAPFLAFCLHYAQVEDVPPAGDWGGWATAWPEAFQTPKDYTPAAGDLVLFDRDGDGTADRVAIVAEVTDGGFTAIEGNAEHAVGQRAYETADSGILGYVVLPQGPKEFTLTAQSESGITVTVTGPRESLPCAAREITLAVTEQVDEKSRAVRDQLLGEEQTEPGRSCLLDITLRQGEEEIEPKGPVTVTFSGLNTQGLYPKVYHIDPDNQTVKEMEAEKTETGDVAVDTDHFSNYLVSTVAAGDLTGYIGDALKNGGTFQLTGNAWTGENGQSAVLTISKNTTIDLNGHTLTISNAEQYFEVQNGATLTIEDSQAPQETVSRNDRDWRYGNTASLSEDGSTLTYYITESTANDTSTTETLEIHEVPLNNAGKILCQGTSSEQLIKVQKDGKLVLEGGVLQNTGGKHVVYVDGGTESNENGETVDKETLTMTGGYIVGGGRAGDPGGGIYVQSGKVNIRGGVVAANRGSSGGGIFVQSGTLNISGGAVTGNEVRGHYDNGGGIYVNGGTLNLSGGYVTNNNKNCGCDVCQSDKNNEYGGGGIALANGTFMRMTGGYVTGNYSSLAGGGIYAGFYAGDGGVHFTMTGGTIASNCAEHGEGGGLRIGGGTTGVLKVDAGQKAYITNNHTRTPDDWGGGGVFVQEHGLLTVVNALITNNNAHGFGGGVGACPTGETLIVNKDGAAIYGNTASGTQMSAGGNDKDYDRTLANNCDVFKYEKRYQDYFCVRKKDTYDNYISLVTGLMAGGGAANWKGSCDEQPVTIGRTGYAAAKYLFGLTADPDDTAKGHAVSAAKVIITGNHSGVHGGGIMTNGGLILGDPGETKVVTARPELDITGTKELVKDGEKQNNGLNFKFQLKDQAGNVIEAESDPDTGIFTFSPNVQNFVAGTYTYTLSEVNGSQPGITYDGTVHTIKVTVKEETVELLKVKFTSYNVSSVTVDGKVVGGSSGSGSGGNTGTGSETGTFKVRYQNTYNWDSVYLYVWKAEDESNKPLGGWPGKPMIKNEPDDTYYYDLPVTGTYNFIFNNNSSSQTGNINNITCEPGKEALFDFNGLLPNSAGGSSGSGDAVGHGSNSDGSYTLVLDTPTFQNTMTTRLDLQIKKTDSVSGEVLKGAKFTLTKAEPGDNVKEEATTNEKGIATFTGIQRGAQYYLRETEPPTKKYMVAGPWILVVGEDGNSATIFPATEKAGGTLEATSENGTTLTLLPDSTTGSGTSGTTTDPNTATGSDTTTDSDSATGSNTATDTTTTNSKVLVLPIQDTPWGYELPETGGAGTTSYTAGGLVLMISGAVLLYIHSKGRKEEKASS